MAFDRDSTTDDVLRGIDLSGRRIVITGAASGLGFESARASVVVAFGGADGGDLPQGGLTRPPRAADDAGGWRKLLIHRGSGNSAR